MEVQLDLFERDPVKEIEDRISTYMAMWKADHQPKTLAALHRAIATRLNLEKVAA